jgi:FkbM family methyltransferase
MWAPYVQWMLLRSAAPVRLKSDPSTAVRGWISFSEYWSFRKGLPESEYLFLKDVRKVSAQPVAIDVGANLGIFALELACLGFEVHAFEPVATTFAKLKKNVAAASARGGRVTINQSACGDREGTVSFAIDERSPATNRVAVVGKDVGALAEVSCTTLDAYCARAGIAAVDFLKIDVEGMEPRVIRGAAGLLRRRKVAAMLIEISPGNLANVNSSVEELLDAIEGFGYGLFQLSPSGVPAGRFDLQSLKHAVLLNALVLPA